ncbi:hypothetical protein ACFL27_11825 [candidate division CSSED10-310 bacterium]|uniref:Core-binding (CB) domain-containing protein n=1 Tax=candidate division CSSED10-310 bacterium TaxID=2855610 RepID=A0ABV6YXT0_UNCC1
MNPTNSKNSLQISTPNKNETLVRIPETAPDTLSRWMEQYFAYEVTTSLRSQKEQRRDITKFIKYVIMETGNDHRLQWIPRLSRAFRDHLINTYNQNKKRSWSDRTINRLMAHLKTWSKWINKLKPFPLGNPMEKIKLLPVGTGLDVERALTPYERRRMLDFADELLMSGGRSKDWHRNRKKTLHERPRRKGYRP